MFRQGGQGWAAPYFPVITFGSLGWTDAAVAFREARPHPKVALDAVAQ